MVHPLEITKNDLDKKRAELEELLDRLNKKEQDKALKDCRTFDEEFIRQKSRHMKVMTDDPRAGWYRDYKRAEYVIARLREKYKI